MITEMMMEDKTKEMTGLLLIMMWKQITKVFLSEK